MRTLLTLLTLSLLLAACGGDETALRDEERIVFFGDSITEMGDQPGGYVQLVRDSLHAAYPEKDIEVIGAGVSGNKIDDLLGRVDRDVLAYDPTTVVVYIGINDVWHWDLPGHTGTEEEDFRQGLHTLVDTLQQADARVILCTPSVIGERRAGENEQDEMLDAYAEVTREVAREQGAELCDLRTAFTEALARANPQNVPEDVLTTDGVHLNEAGNRFVAERMVEALEGT